MKFTKSILTLGTAALLASTTLADAQGVRFSDIDRDGNGRLSYGELESTFGSRGAAQVWSRGGGREQTRADVRAQNTRADDDRDDGRFSRGGRDDDDDDRGRGGRDDDDDDGGRSSGGGREDDDDD